MDQRSKSTLVRFIEARRGRAFEWGRTDCATIALEWIDELLGSSHGASIIGSYSSAAEALDVYRGRGADWPAFLLSIGAREIRKNFQQDGDLLVRPGKHFETIAIMVGRWVFTVDEKSQIAGLDPWKASDDWRVFRIPGPIRI